MPRVVLFKTVAVPVLNAPLSGTLNPIEDCKVSDALLYLINFLIPVEPIPIPAPSNSAFVGTVDAIPTTKSPNSTSPVLTDMVAPSTYKSPLILTLPVLSPTAAGSMNISCGPVIVLPVILIPTSLAPVDNLEKVAIPVLFRLPLPSEVLIPVNAEPSPLNDAAVTIPEATTVSNTE